MLKKALAAAALAAAVLAVVIALRPAEFRVARSAVIPAPPAKVFPHVNDLHAWEEWSPWAKLDPQAKSTFEGPASGVGAVMKWSGNKEVGEGAMTITESRPNELVRFKLDFVRPMAGTNDAEFSFKKEGAGTAVTWTMSGRNGFLGKAMGLFIDCDKMVGKQFEQGLDQLGAAVKKKPAK